METGMMFSTLTIAGDDISSPVTLSREEDFPSHRFQARFGRCTRKPTWRSSQVPETAGHLSLRLGERISRGRSAVTYVVEVISADPEVTGTAPTYALPVDQQLCIKVARPNRCRTLAREAWFYSRLRDRTPWRQSQTVDHAAVDDDGQLQGVIAPHFYGFFAAPMSPGRLSFPPWFSQDFEPMHAPDLGYGSVADDPTCDDPLPDDGPVPETRSLDGEQRLGGKECSKWDQWSPDLDAPLLTVIVMARGGSTYTYNDHSNEATREDVLEILDDLSGALVVHGDLRPANLVRAPASTVLCSRHQRVHQWNMIDFAWSLRTDYGNLSRRWKESTKQSSEGPGHNKDDVVERRINQIRETVRKVQLIGLEHYSFDF
ncbi:hypothetical protein CONPUDRAFT_164301 [Coniophora puteana RWD-64-598 SS2]|uniref:Protein kinase domain-containing protein n=1 Tax=Coniophora puteana (strain RWD-64-598) TaxID=741705 RepID=A0A5M3MW02_CONPW|nr:uncharacterized protein CONPUDRAFT_164301 [Coniophora puteana RWD-64-598 SS2]EIW83338.1 hypothetical protein CONPUDRAFT_164301 [Coniophora puteana RWD-64-598 SS2]